MKTSKFCAGATLGDRKVESIHPTAKIATTAMPAAIPGIPVDGGFPEYMAWVMFSVLGLCFVLALVMDKIETKGGG